MAIPEFIEIVRIFGGWGVAGYFVAMMMTDRLMTAAERDRLLKEIAIADKDLAQMLVQEPSYSDKVEKAAQRVNALQAELKKKIS